MHKMTTKSGNLGLGSLEKWDIATTKKFLKLYRNHRCLWDHTDAAYKDKAERQNALENIASAMNIPGFDSRYVVLKVRALRSTYLYERRKVRLRLKNGEKFQTHLGWFHLADSFLRNYVVEKSYLHGDDFKDPNLDLPPPVEGNSYENDVDGSSSGFPKNETTGYEIYECPKSQMTSYEDNEDQEFQLHVLEVQQPAVQQQNPPQQQLQEVQMKSPMPMKITRAQTRRSDKVPSKRSKVDVESSVQAYKEDKSLPIDHNLPHVQTPPKQQQNQITYLTTISQPATPAPPAVYINSNKNDESTISQISEIGSASSNVVQNDCVSQNKLSNNTKSDDEDEFDAFAKSVAMQLKKIPKAEAYGLQVQFQLLLSQAKLKAMGKGNALNLSLNLSGLLGN